MARALRPFHVAVPVQDLTASRRFYGELLGCAEGRSADDWVDFDLYGHQFVCHLSAGDTTARGHNRVDGKAVPVPHCGVVLSLEEWELLATRLQQAEITFLLEPQRRFVGQAGEQATLFVADPSGNVLEFKAMADATRLFARD
jgi:extradiol dioxygenase family protein